MLAGALSYAMSKEPSPKLKPINNDNIMNMISTVEVPSEDLVWPVRCLVKMAVVRSCLPSAILMLNATIPNELRWRAPKTQGLASAPRPPLGLFLVLVNAILGSTATATRLFLDMLDGPIPYWFSVDEDTKLALSLVSIHGQYVMLREPEVRSYVLDCLNAEINSLADSANNSSKSHPLPNEWLKELVSGVFFNAECDLGFGMDVNSVSRSISSNAEEIACYRQEMIRVGKLLVPQKQSCGLDFDLVISALLVLARKYCAWKDGTRLSTQSLLNTVCDMVGRKTNTETGNPFVFEKSIALRLCALSDNLQAAAFLVGGKKGLILECADLVVSATGMTVKDAEIALFVGSLAELKVTAARVYEGVAQEQEPMFTPSANHQHIMWLLEEHVLNVHTYGAFDSSSHSRKIDPVYAGRVCFRAWYCLTHPSVLCSSSKWLERWMRRKLDLTTGTSRLACAALVRILLWAEEVGGLDLSDGGDETLLADFLRFDGQFMAVLAESCCGLIYSIPPHLAEELMSSFGCSNVVSFEA